MRSQSAAGRDGVEALLDQADRLVQDGAFAAAEDRCQAALARMPDCLRAFVLLYQLARRQRQPMRALAWIYSARDLDADDTGLRLDQAELLIEVGRWGEARASLAALHDLAPDLAAPCLLLGRIERRFGRPAQAVAWFRKAGAATPGDTTTMLELCETLVACGDLAEAEAALGWLPAAALDDAAVRLRLGHLARLRQDRRAAIDHLRAAFALDPRQIEARCWLVTECREQGLFDAAAQLIATTPEDQSATLHLMLEQGRVARASGAPDAARAAFAAACAAHPRSADAWTNLAVSQLALADPAAPQSLARALDIDPAHLEAGLHLANWQLAGGEAAAARALCRNLRRGHGHALAVWLTESRVAEAEGGPDAGLSCLDEAPAALQQHQDLLARRIEIELRAGRVAAVRARLLQAGPPSPLHPESWCGLVQATLQVGWPDRAQALLETPPQGSPAIAARGLFLRGQLAEAQWAPDLALRCYREAVGIDPTAAPIHQDIARVAMVTLDIAAARAAMGSYIRMTAGERRIRGEQCKVSQTHIGQILEEYVLDPEMVSALARLAGLPAPQRVAALRALARERPDSTPCASTLMLALRQAGALAGTPAGTEAAIPRTIFQFWAQGTPDDDVQALMASWRAHHPDHRYVLFDDARAQHWLGRFTGAAALLAFRRARSPAQKGDLLRLALLTVHGGFYADADDMCLGPLDRVVAPGCGFLAYQEDYLTLGNNLLGAAPGHPVLRRALGQAVAAINEGHNETLWLSTGPGLLTRSFAQVFAEGDRPVSWMDGITILDRHVLADICAMHCSLRYKTTNQHWVRALGQAHKPTPTSFRAE